MIDPRTDLPQASIPQGGGYTNFDALRGCVVHWFSDCVLVSGGSQRTDSIRPSSNAPGPLSQSRGTTTAASSSGTTSAVLPQDPSFSFVLIVSDSCVYVFDKSAVVIRCIPIATIARLIVLDLVARDARSSDAIRQHAARGAARESGIDQESAHELLQQAAHQLLGSSNSKAAAAMPEAAWCRVLVSLELPSRLINLQAKSMTAVVIRCIPIATIARLIVLDLVARDARSSDAIRQHAARGAARESGIDQESAHELLQQAAHQLLGSSNSKAAAAMSRSGVVPCFSLLGIAVASDQSTSKEHDLLVGVPLGATEELCGILLRIHWAHLGPNTKLAVEAVDLTPVRRHKQPRGGTSGRGEELLVVPTIGDVFHGIDDAAVPPLLGLDTTRSPHWELHVEPLRRSSQLEELLSKKHAMLVNEVVAIESASRRIKSSLTEHSSFEQRDRWRQMAQQNRKLTDAVKALEAEVVISRRLLEQEVPGGLELLKKLVAGGGALQAPGLSAIDSISGNALFNV
ncbi:GPI-anchored surface protein, putative, partial [Bodo saltans]